MKINYKSILPHGIAILVFIVFASVYFSPLFKGYSLNQGDVKQFQGMSKEIVDHRIVEETDPLWTNSMFSGMPAYQISVLHENNFVRYIDQMIKLGLPRPVGIMFISMLGFYILLLCLRVNPWLGIAGAVAFGFSTINILYLGAGHMTKVNAIAYMAPALGGMLLAFRGRWMLGSAVFALFLALQLSANHLQMTYYLIFILVFVALGEVVRIVRNKQMKSLVPIVGGLLIGILMAIAPSMSNISTTKEYSEFSTRGSTRLTIEPEGKKKEEAKISGLNTDYILQYNYGEGELLSMIIPNARGERGGLFANDEDIIEHIETRDVENDTQFQDDKNYLGQNRYWGGQMASGGAFYFGVVIFVLFVLAVVYLKDILKWPLLILVILVMALASNDPGGVNDFFIHKFPLYNKFRDSKMILVLLQIILPFLAILFVDQLVKGNVIIERQKKFFISGGLVLFLFALIYFAPSISGDFITKDENKSFSKVLNEDKSPESREYLSSLKSEIKETREFLFKKDVGRAFLFSLLILGLVYFIVLKRPSIWLVSASLLLLVSTDNIGISLRYLNSNESESGDGQDEYVNALASAGYIDEVEELDPLEKYQNQSLFALPQIAGPSDYSILNKEKGSIKGFSNKVADFKKRMTNELIYEGITNDKSKNMIAEFAVLNLNTNYRVLTKGNPFNETQTSYFHKSIGGYHGAKLKRYQELVDFYIQREYALLFQNAANFGSSVFQYTPVLNMLNTKYFVADRNKEAITNPYANGNAWFVENIEIVDNADQEMLAIGDSTIDLKSTAVINIKDFQNIQVPAQFDSESFIELTKYGLNHLKYKSISSFAAPVIFSEIYYPKGWNCYIDGKLVETFRANYVLRGVMVPKGEHEIVWKFEPDSMKTGSLISGIGSTLLILTCLFVFFFEIRTHFYSKHE